MSTVTNLPGDALSSQELSLQYAPKKIRTIFDRKRVETINNEPSMTKQAFQKECDINTILDQFSKTGVITHINERSANYVDVSASVDDYHSAMNILVQAQTAFNDLPATLRERFANDPARFLEFVNDPANEKEFEALGLVTPKTSSEPPKQPVQAVSETAPKDAS